MAAGAWEKEGKARGEGVEKAEEGGGGDLKEVVGEGEKGGGKAKEEGMGVGEEKEVGEKEVGEKEVGEKEVGERGRVEKEYPEEMVMLGEEDAKVKKE